MLASRNSPAARLALRTLTWLALGLLALVPLGCGLADQDRQAAEWVEH